MFSAPRQPHYESPSNKLGRRLVRDMPAHPRLPPHSPGPARSRIPASVFATHPKPAPRSSPARGRELLAPDVAPSAIADMSVPDLRAQISSLESEMARLLARRNVLGARLEQEARAQSPIARLPSELLAGIFAIGILDADEDDALLVSTLMLVSRHFNDVALKTPILWSRITVSNHYSINMARRMLLRSKSVPVHVCIDFNPNLERGGSTTQTVVQAMDMLRASICRWKSFRLKVPTRPQAHAALVRCNEDAPLLETFSVQIHNSLQEEHFPSPLPLFNGRAPRLRSCSFTSFNFSWDVRPVSRLHILRLDAYWNSFAPSIPVILDILRLCPELEEFALRNMSDVDPEICAVYDPENASQGCDHIPSLPAHPIQLPRLKKLVFHYAGIHRVRAVLSQLLFPALESLELCYMDNVSPVFKFLQRQALTSLPLRHLRIESSCFSEPLLLKSLRRLPSMLTLELVDVEDVSAHLLKGLSAPSPVQSWICPRLETLNLDGCTSFGWASLCSFVESRLPSHLRSHPHPPASASTSTHAHHRQAPHATRSLSAPPCDLATLGWPRRLHALHLSRCHQISREMVQWLRIYVVDVKFDKTRGLWGEASS